MTLEIHYRDETLTIGASRPKVTIGRDGTNGISIAAPVVSRHHADIVMRGDKFLLIDRSPRSVRPFAATVLGMLIALTGWAAKPHNFSHPDGDEVHQQAPWVPMQP